MIVPILLESFYFYSEVFLFVQLLFVQPSVYVLLLCMYYIYTAKCDFNAHSSEWWSGYDTDYEGGLVTTVSEGGLVTTLTMRVVW